MTVRFLHTADWQLGKPFAGIADVPKRSRVQQERLEVIARLGRVAEEHQAAFILVAGDLFDSASVTRSTVSAACHALGSLGRPVFAIPGNHDHAGPGSLWDQEFFQRECARLAPHFRLLSVPEPVVTPEAVILPCPLRRRAETTDPTAWLRDPALLESLPPDLPRLVLAHGSIQGFGATPDEEDAACGTPNLLDLSRLPLQELDYIALGDWHGTHAVSSRAWYSGTPEPDRFPRGGNNNPGNVLAVTAARGSEPVVVPHRTAHLVWTERIETLADDAALDRLQATLEAEGGRRSPDTLLRLELSGSLGLDATARLDRWLESLDALLLRLKLIRRTVVAPTPAECSALAERPGDPLISRVAARLLAMSTADTPEAAVARTALRELHAACSRT